jgi:hypothetical protein
VPVKNNNKGPYVESLCLSINSYRIKPVPKLHSLQDLLCQLCIANPQCFSPIEVLFSQINVIRSNPLLLRIYYLIDSLKHSLFLRIQQFSLFFYCNENPPHHTASLQYIHNLSHSHRSIMSWTMESTKISHTMPHVQAQLQTLPYSIYDFSSHSASYHPRNIMENKPMDQSSRWSSGTNNQMQYIMLKLDRPAIVRILFLNQC